MNKAVPLGAESVEPTKGGGQGKRGTAKHAPDLTDLHDRVHRGTYRAQPARRRYIGSAISAFSA